MLNQHELVNCFQLSRRSVQPHLDSLIEAVRRVRREETTCVASLLDKLSTLCELPLESDLQEAVSCVLAELKTFDSLRVQWKNVGSRSMQKFT